METQIVTALNINLISQWQNLWNHSRFSTFFNSPQWFQASCEAFKIKTFVIICVYQEQDLIAVLPLIKSRKYGLRVLCSPGGKYLDRSTLLLDHERVAAVLDILLKKIGELGSIFLAEIDQFFVEKISYRNLNFLKETASLNPYIDLSQDPFRFVSRKQRSSIINRIKKNELDIKFHLYRDQLNEHLKTIFSIESKSYKKKKGRDIFYKPVATKLFQNIINYAPDKSAIGVLFFRELPIAHMFGLFYRNVFLAYHMAYMSEYRKLMPGKMLLFYLLPILREQGIGLFDFSRGESMLKRQFTEVNTTMYNLYFPKNLFVAYFWKSILSVKEVITFAKKIIKHLLFKKGIARGVR